MPDSPDGDARPKAVAAPPAEGKVDPPAAPVKTEIAIPPPSEAPPATPAIAQGVVMPPIVSALADTYPIFVGLDRLYEEIGQDADTSALINTLAAGGALASAGYVVLNTRAVYWFLSALLARPAIWRRFDPLDVIYAWEREREDLTSRTPKPEDDESLQSIVE